MYQGSCNNNRESNFWRLGWKWYLLHCFSIVPNAGQKYIELFSDDLSDPAEHNHLLIMAFTYSIAKFIKNCINWFGE